MGSGPGAAPHGGRVARPQIRGPDGPGRALRAQSERVLSPVRWGGWSSVRLTFDLPGYIRVQTNSFRATLVVTNRRAGASVLDVGPVCSPVR